MFAYGIFLLDSTKFQHVFHMFMSCFMHFPQSSVFSLNIPFIFFSIFVLTYLFFKIIPVIVFFSIIFFHRLYVLLFLLIFHGFSLYICPANFKAYFSLFVTICPYLSSKLIAYFQVFLNFSPSFLLAYFLFFH